MNNDKALPTVLHYLLHWEGIQPDAVYLRQPQPDGRVIDYSWREVGDQARRMAEYLSSLQLPAQSSIALLGKNSAHWIIADLAIAIAGHVSVPIYPSANAATIAYVLDHSDARLLFVGKLDGGSDRWEALRSHVPAHLPLIGLPLSMHEGEGDWDAIVARMPRMETFELPAPERLATIIYTSGTTGHPKGVMHSFGSMYWTPRGMQQISHNGDGLGPSDRMISYLPLAHVAERAGVEATSLRVGCSIYFSDRAETFLQDLRRVQPTVLFSVPRLWTKFYQGINQRIPLWVQRIAFVLPGVSALLKRKILVELGLDRVKTAYTGSAALPVAIVAWYRNLGLELLEGCGMSENFGYAHFSRSGRVRVGYVGECMPGVQCRIAEDGEILVKSPGQMLGYYKRAEQTAESYTEDGFFKTGDCGALDELGRLRITGRVKELFKTSKGKYVAPVPLEMKLVGHPLIEDACVTGVGLPQPFALVTLSEEARKALTAGDDNASLGAELETLIEQVNSQTEGHERLDRLVVVKDPWTIDSGLLTPTLKIRRSLIEKLYEEQFDGWSQSGRKVIFE